MHVSLINVFAFGLALFLSVFTFNVARVSNDRLDLQYAVDAAAISAATVKARGMNSITALNHIIGELHAFTVMHDAIGGVRADQPNRYSPINGPAVQARNRRLWLAASASRGLGSFPIAFRRVRQNINANQALFDAKQTLKTSLAQLYEAKTAILLIGVAYPPAMPWCRAFVRAVLDPIDRWIRQEDIVLYQTLRFAVATSWIKTSIRRAVIPALRVTQQAIQLAIPGIAKQSGESVAARHGIHVDFNPEDLMLPLVPDPMTRANGPVRIPTVRPRDPRPLGNRANNVHNQIAKTTQLARAAYPWVLYHRQGLTRITNWVLPISRFSSHYRYRTFKQTVEQTAVLRSWSYALPVLNEYPAPNKGFALWTEDGRRAEPHFGVLAIGSRAPSPLLGIEYFKGTGRKQYVFSEAMVYNANPQERRDRLMDVRRRLGNYRRQPRIGYDTLNFVGRVSETVVDPRITRYPAIRLNWQSKLVPASAAKIQASLRGMPSDVQRRFANFELTPEMVGTH